MQLMHTHALAGCDPITGPQRGSCAVARGCREYPEWCFEVLEYEQRDGSCCPKRCNYKDASGNVCYAPRESDGIGSIPDNNPRSSGPVNDGGRCTSDSQCGSGSYCSSRNVCARFSRDYCNNNQCGEGDGDCDSDQQCAGGLVCGEDNCVDFHDISAATGFQEASDCCKSKLLLLKFRFPVLTDPWIKRLFLCLCFRHVPVHSCRCDTSSTHLTSTKFMGHT